jgi:hypothetical protein
MAKDRKTRSVRRVDKRILKESREERKECGTKRMNKDSKKEETQSMNRGRKIEKRRYIKWFRK